MRVKGFLTVAGIGLALAGAPVGGFAQSQAEKTGRGGASAVDRMTSAASQPIAIAGAAVIAAGVAIASASSDHHDNTGVATVTSTSTR